MTQALVTSTAVRNEGLDSGGYGGAAAVARGKKVSQRRRLDSQSKRSSIKVENIADLRWKDPYIRVKQAHCVATCKIPKIPAKQAKPEFCEQQARSARLAGSAKMFARAHV